MSVTGVYASVAALAWVYFLWVMCFKRVGKENPMESSVMVVALCAALAWIWPITLVAVVLRRIQGREEEGE